MRFAKGMRVRHKEFQWWEGVIVDAGHIIEHPDYNEVGAWVRWEGEEFSPLGIQYMECHFYELEILDNGIERAVKACL